VKLQPLLFLAGRYLKSRRRHRGVGAPVLSLVGLAVGVLTLNAVLAVMNGFQLTFIESLVELSSSHLRWTPGDGKPDSRGAALVGAQPGVRAVVPTTEGQILVSSALGGRHGALLRGFPSDALQRDPSLGQRLHLDPGVGRPGLPGPGEVLIGAELSRALGVGPGDSVELTSLTGPEFSLLKPHVVKFTVKGTFSTGYYEIDAGWVIASLDDALATFAGPSDFFYAVKLTDGNRDRAVARTLPGLLGRPAAEFTTWRDYNAAFFGALRTEKAVMMVLVGLIFFVVGVNIYFSQKRAVAEHREDLALWAAVGVRPRRLRLVFAFEGLAVGVAAAVVGTVLGLAVAWSFGSLDLLSSEAFYLPSLPARVLPHEVFFVALACVVSSTGAAWLASAGATRIPIAEVLKSE
jgi:lipoprotein-releasing system permease protein